MNINETYIVFVLSRQKLGKKQVKILIKCCISATSCPLCQGGKIESQQKLTILFIQISGIIGSLKLGTTFLHKMT